MPVGSLLVQSDVTSGSGEPLLLQANLPTYVRFRHLAEKAWVFLLDTQVGFRNLGLDISTNLAPHFIRLELGPLHSCPFASCWTTVCAKIT